MSKELIVSSSPHLQAHDTTRRIMLDVVIALIPAFIAATVIFGWIVPIITAATIAACVLSEYISRKILKRDNTIGDLSAVVTGMLLSFNLPATLDSIWMGVLGGAIAIIVVKQLFGGIGQNFVNPALIARIILMVSFPTKMTTWPAPLAWIKDGGIDATTTATPLAIMSEGSGEGLPSIGNMLLGLRGGCLGETCAIALIIGGIYLIARKVISPIIPVCFIGTAAIFMMILDFAGIDGSSISFLPAQLLSGGLLLGAIFMATDYTTSPINFTGKIIFAIGCGLITVIIRFFASLPEGVSYSIIIMNLLVPHIERLTRPRPFGDFKEKKVKGGAKA